jgi:hypothetical protein
MNFKERKTYRKDYYLRFVYGWKLRPCTACSGSGYYDHKNSPKCGAAMEQVKKGIRVNERFDYWDRYFANLWRCCFRHSVKLKYQSMLQCS